MLLKRSSKSWRRISVHLLDFRRHQVFLVMLEHLLLWCFLISTWCLIPQPISISISNNSNSLFIKPKLLSFSVSIRTLEDRKVQITMLVSVRAPANHFTCLLNSPRLEAWCPNSFSSTMVCLSTNLTSSNNMGTAAMQDTFHSLALLQSTLPPFLPRRVALLNSHNHQVFLSSLFLTKKSPSSR